MLYKAPEARAKRFKALSRRSGPSNAIKRFIRLRKGRENVKTLNQTPESGGKRLNAL